MKVFNVILATVTTLSMATIVWAHDVEEHMKNGEKPDCAALANVDMAKMDKDDPVTQALMKKCTQQMQHNDGHMAQYMNDHHEAGEMHGRQEGEAAHEEQAEHQEHH